MTTSTFSKGKREWRARSKAQAARSASAPRRAVRARRARRARARSAPGQRVDGSPHRPHQASAVSGSRAPATRSRSRSKSTSGSGSSGRQTASQNGVVSGAVKGAAVAVGATAVGIAGGLVIKGRQRRPKVLGIPLPSVSDIDVKSIAKAWQGERAARREQQVRVQGPRARRQAGGAAREDPELTAMSALAKPETGGAVARAKDVGGPLMTRGRRCARSGRRRRARRAPQRQSPARPAAHRPGRPARPQERPRDARRGRAGVRPGDPPAVGEHRRGARGAGAARAAEPALARRGAARRPDAPARAHKSEN